MGSDGAELYHKYAFLRTSIDAATEYLKSELGCHWSASHKTFSAADSSE